VGGGRWDFIVKRIGSDGRQAMAVKMSDRLSVATTAPPLAGTAMLPLSFVQL